MLMLLCMIGPPFGMFFASLAFGEGSLAATVRMLAMLVGSMVLGFLVWKFGFRIYRYAVEEVRAIVQEEMRTGHAILPDDVAIRWGVRRYSVPPRPSEESLRRMRLANRMEKRRLPLFLPIAAFVGFVVPFGVFIAYDIRGPVPVTVTSILTFWPIVATLVLAARMRDGPAMLRELREYERVSGRRVLPDDLSSATAPRTP